MGWHLKRLAWMVAEAVDPPIYCLLEVCSSCWIDLVQNIDWFAVAVVVVVGSMNWLMWQE